MKVVALIPSLAVGGAERSLIKLVQVIAPLVDCIDVVCMAHVDSRIAGELPAGVRLHVLGNQSSASPLLWIQVVRLLRNNQPDLVIGWSTYANFVTLLAARFVPHARIVLSERNYLPGMFGRKSSSGLRRLIILKLMRWLYPHADVITANSLASTRFLKKYIGGKPEYRLLPNVVDIKALDARADEAQVEIEHGTGPRILAVGRLVRQKGFDVLLKALALTIAARPGWSLVIVGDGPEREKLRGEAQALGLEQHIHWLGAQTNPFPFYRWADIVVVPSRYEGFPNVPLEAMALGRAIICSDCRSGPSELTSNGQYGRLVAVGDVEALARAMVAVGDSPEIMRTLGEAARIHVWNNYDVSAMRTRYADVLGITPSKL